MDKSLFYPVREPTYQKYYKTIILIYILLFNKNINK